LFALLLVLPLLAIPPGARAETSPSNAPLDPRLEGFLVQVIQDKAQLEKEKQIYAAQHVSLEAFIFFVYTRSIQIDSTADNAVALAQLGGYLEEKRPALSPKLEKEMKKFYARKANQTFMRGMFLTTIHGLSARR
jgi:hypothetical protein